MRVAEIYRRMDRPRRALSTLDEIARRFPAAQLPLPVLHEQQLALKSLGRLQSAEQKLAQLARREPTPDRLCELSDLRRKLGRPQQAREAAARALAIDPQHHAAKSLYVALSDAAAAGAVQQAGFLQKPPPGL